MTTQPYKCPVCNKPSDKPGSLPEGCSFSFTDVFTDVICRSCDVCGVIWWALQPVKSPVAPPKPKARIRERSSRYPPLTYWVLDIVTPEYFELLGTFDTEEDAKRAARLAGYELVKDLRE